MTALRLATLVATLIATVTATLIATLIKVSDGRVGIAAHVFGRRLSFEPAR
jgi:hypothetical protein